MKNKKITYLLGVCVILIWGIVFYRIYSGMSDDNSATPVVSNKAIVLPDSVDAVDTFSLIANYRDPFLGNVPVVRVWNNNPGVVANNVVKARKEVKPKEPEIPMDWSFISYLGIITNPANKKRVLLLNINGRQYMANESETVENVKILKNYGDSVKVEFQGKTCCLKK